MVKLNPFLVVNRPFGKIERRTKNMSIRAYLPIDIKGSVQPEKADEIIQRIDALDEVDTVSYSHDIISMAEVQVTVKITIEKIKNIVGIDSTQACRILGGNKKG
ncbi:MAG: hypothetical protein U9R75_02435 [Candidatus Thermoplasmatota archaeon]|nr:hypothetical protein [Candidatus Thermoplasmatota archaeon]